MNEKQSGTVDVLAFVAHPDDAEIFCGGFLLKMHELGHRTGVVDLTRGEMSSQGDAETRAKETEAATAVLGLSYRANLEFPDGAVGVISGGDRYLAEDGELAKIVTEIRTLRPALLLLPYWKDRHPDHSRAGKLLTEAIFYAGLKKFLPQLPVHSPIQTLYFQMRYTFRPTFVCDITSVEEKKIEAICCYESQVKRRQPGIDTLISSPLTLDVIRAKDQYYGAMIGVRYGEPLLARNTLALDDPVKYFREQAARKPHIFNTF